MELASWSRGIVGHWRIRILRISSIKVTTALEVLWVELVPQGLSRII